MSPRGRDGDAPGAEAPGPDGTRSVSSFDAAQDLLQAALDDVRATAGQPPKPRAPAAPVAPPASGTSADDSPRSGDPDLWAPRGPAPTATRATQRRRAAAAAAATEAATAQAPPGAHPAPGATTPPAPSGPKRRTRRNADPAPGPGATPSAGTVRTDDEFSGLTDDMYVAPDRRRRRRRTATATAATATAAAAATQAADLPPMPASAFTAEPAAPDVEPVPARAAEPEPEPVVPARVAEPTSRPPEPASVPIAVASAASAAPVTYDLSSERSKRRAGPIVAAIAVAAAVLIAFAVVVLPGGGSDDAALNTPPAARYTFDKVTTPEGAEVSRVWELQGPRGSEFVGELEFVNPGDTPMQTSFTEVIPKSLAPTVDDIRFEPQPVVVQADPVVRYDLTIPAGATATVRYEIDVPPEGATRARLAAWAEELTVDTTTTTTTTTTAAPEVPTPPTTAARTTPATTPGTTPPPTGPPVPPPTNPPEPPPAGTGVIVMRIRSNGGTGTFFLSGPGTGAVVETTGAPNGFGQVGYTVDVGSHPWTLQPADGWAFVGTVCEDRGGSADTVVAGNTVIFNVQADETVVCTFTVQKL